MSRNTVPGKAPAGRLLIDTVVAGWDRPLQQWFAQGLCKREVVWTWSGNSLDKLADSAEHEGDIHLPISLLQQLTVDGEQDAGNSIRQFPMLNLSKEEGLILSFQSADVLPVIDHALQSTEWLPVLLCTRTNGEPLFAPQQPGLLLKVAAEGVLLQSAGINPSGGQSAAPGVHAEGYGPGDKTPFHFPGELELPLVEAIVQPQLSDLRKRALMSTVIELVVTGDGVEFRA